MLIGQPAFSQNDDIIAARIQSVQNNYTDANVGGILSGKSYSLKYRFAIDSQFYNDSYPSSGSLLYDGVFFSAIEIQYDLFIQKIIVLLETKSSSRYISLDTEKVAGFSINEFQFTHITKDSVMASGIYELVYSGTKSQVYIKRLKNKRDKTKDGKNVIVFEKENRYYLKNEFGTFQITNKKSLFYAYQYSERIKVLIKESKIKLSKKKLEQGLVTAISLIDPKQ